MNIFEIVNPYGQLIKMVGEKREFPRFKLPGLNLKINDKIYEVVDISYTGIGLAHHDDLVPIKFINGKLCHESSISIPIKISKCHDGPIVGFKFEPSKDLTELLNQWLSYDKIAQDLSIARVKKSEWICYMCTSSKLLMQTSSEKKVLQMFFIVGQSLVFWEHSSGLKTGFINNSDDLENLNNNCIFDEYIDVNKIKFFKQVISENKKITQSFRDWVIEKISFEFSA